MTTALRDSQHCIQSFREGCESYVTKPVDERELLGRMRELGLLREEPAAR
jgi:DNA-binding response OmpR family regulator